MRCRPHLGCPRLEEDLAPAQATGPGGLNKSPLPSGCGLPSSPRGDRVCECALCFRGAGDICQQCTPTPLALFVLHLPEISSLPEPVCPLDLLKKFALNSKLLVFLSACFAIFGRKKSSVFNLLL